MKQIPVKWVIKKKQKTSKIVVKIKKNELAQEDCDQLSDAWCDTSSEIYLWKSCLFEGRFNLNYITINNKIAEADKTGPEMFYRSKYGLYNFTEKL